MNSILGSYHAAEWQKQLVSTLTIFALLIWTAAPLLAFPQIARADETAYFTPTATHSPNGWSGAGDVNTVANVQTSDDVYATDNDEDEQGYANFNIPAIPANSAINGITVSVEANASDASGCQLETRLSWNNGSSNTAIQSSALTGADAVYTFGGASDTWGRSWTPAQFTNANFVVKVGYDDESPSGCSGGATLSVDQIQVKVAYTPPTANPALPSSCGIDIALVMDSSGSIGSSNLTVMENALKGFVDAFLPATPTLFSVTDFDTTAHSPSLAFTDDATAIKSAIEAAVSGGSTNWQDGLENAFATFDPRPDANHPNLIIFASDGEPNKYGDAPATGPGFGFDQASFEAAVAEANAIKGAGTRIVTLGIGASVSANNLKAISSEDAYYSSADFANLTTTLNEIVTDLCGGTITVHKVIDADGNLETASDQTDGAGWSFDVAGNAQVTDINGDTTPVEVDAGTYSVTETVQSGYSVVSASCVNQDQVSEGSWNQGNAVTTIEVGSSDIVSCTFYNTPNAATLTVTKNIVGDAGAAPEDFSFTVNDGSAQSFEADGSNDVLIPPGSFTVAEVAPGASWSVTYGDGCDSALLPGDSVECIITNTFVPEEETTITLIKYVITDNGGEAGINDFGLSIGGTPVNSGQTLLVTAGVPIELTELGLEGYHFVSVTGDEGCPTSLPGSVTLSEGQDLVCTITNDDEPAQLTVVKNTIGGDAEFGFDINAYEYNFGFDITTSGGTGTSELISLNAGTYAVQETYIPEGWNFSGSSCLYEGDSVGYEITNGEQITVDVGDEVTCTFTNTLPPPAPACSDGVDNDDAEDDLEDAQDPGCHSDGDANNSSSYVPSDTDEGNAPQAPQCSDGEDNDEDILEDIEDPGCWTDPNDSETYDKNDDSENNAPQCSDNADNGDSEDTVADTQDPGCHADYNPLNSWSYNPNDDDETDPTDGGDDDGPGGPPGGGPIGGGGGGGGGPIGGGIVAGASTGPVGEVLGDACGLYMDKYIRLGSSKNNAEQVKKLQEFLNKWMQAGLPVTGFYGPMSFGALQAFQAKYGDGVLKPWNIPAPTGIVYITTLHQINMLECPELTLQLPPLVPWTGAGQ